jgi:predicted enzyme related to lactoylglutathione lyase
MPFRDIGRVVVLVHDQDEALQFYRDVLGFETLHDSAAGGCRYLHMGPAGGAGVWLMTPSGEQERGLVGRQAGGQPLLVLYTDDIDHAADRLRDHGVPVWAERTEADSRSLHFRDVAGNVMVAAQLTSRAAPASDRN